MVGDFLSLFGMVFAVVLTCFMAYFATRYLSKIGVVSGMKGQGDNKMHVRERLFIAPNKCLMLVEIAGKWFVISVSNDNISLIIELSESDTKDWDSIKEKEQSEKKFSDVLSQILKNKK